MSTENDRPGFDPSVAVHGAFRTRVTGYRGIESEILDLRNANRETVRSRKYLDWRYATVSSAPAATVIWMDEPSGNCIGMASVIPRAYWIDGNAESVGVLGDISLDAAYRGKGIGRQLLAAVTQHCSKAGSPRYSIVIPTEAARRALATLEWSTASRLLQLVLLVDPHEKLIERLGRDTLSTPLTSTYRSLLKGILWLQRRKGYTLERCNRFDDSFEGFWLTFPKCGLCLADRSPASLNWRYVDHPNERFQIRKLLHEGRLVGYLVFTLQDRMCSIFDVLVRTPRYLVQLLALFAGEVMEKGLSSVRVTLNDDHPYRRVFQRMGFISRNDSTVLQVLDTTPFTSNGKLTWMLTQGDKDI